MTDSSAAQIIGNEDATAKQLARIWQDLLGVESIGPGENYFDLGGDSSLAVHMFAQVEKQFHVKLPLATLYEAPTIAELACILHCEAPVAGWSPLVAIQPTGSRPAFFCFHGAGGNVLSYRQLSMHLGSDQPFYGLQCQGLDGACPPLVRIEDMAALYVKEIRRVQRRGPYFLGGYCMGGTLAFEAAQQLHAAGESIALLALFDTMDWSKISVTPWSMSHYTWQRLVFHAANFLGLDSAGKSKFFREKIGVLRSRIPVWRGMLLAKLGTGSDAASRNRGFWVGSGRQTIEQCGTTGRSPIPARSLTFAPRSNIGYSTSQKQNGIVWPRKGKKSSFCPSIPRACFLSHSSSTWLTH